MVRVEAGPEVGLFLPVHGLIRVERPLEENRLRIQVSDLLLALLNRLLFPLVGDYRVGLWSLHDEPFLVALLRLFSPLSYDFGSILENFDFAAVNQLLPSGW